MVRCSIEPRDGIYVKGYRFLSFVKNVAKFLAVSMEKRFLTAQKISKILS